MPLISSKSHQVAQGKGQHNQGKDGGEQLNSFSINSVDFNLSARKTTTRTS
jgi:hypothetical protein